MAAWVVGQMICFCGVGIMQDPADLLFDIAVLLVSKEENGANWLIPCHMVGRLWGLASQCAMVHAVQPAAAVALLHDK